MNLHSLFYIGLVYYQPSQQLTRQAVRMATDSIPYDVLDNLDIFVLLIFLPLCELVVGSDECLD